MTSTQVNGNTSNNNGPLGKRKKTRNKGSYLSKWLDKTLHHIQEATPSMDTYDSYLSNVNWQNNYQVPVYDPRMIYGCAEHTSLPTMPTYYNPMLPMYPPDCRYVQNVNKSVQVQRPRQRRRSENKAEEVHSTPIVTPNGTLTSNYLQPKNFIDSQDFASLPPIVTSVGDTTSNSDMNTNEKDDGCNARRYSDPCVRGLPDVARANGDTGSDSEDSSGLSGSQVGSKLLTCLIDQITSLKMANERLTKDLQETKAELSSMQQHTLWQKGPAMGTSPNNNIMMNGQYSPGFLSDMVREIRDAARAREEALYSRINTMFVERNDNGLPNSDSKYAEKVLDDIKCSLRASEADKRRMMDRITKLEDELRSLRLNNSTSHKESNANNNVNDNDGESDMVRLRKEVTDLRKAKQNAEEHALKLERLVTQLRSKFNGIQLSPNGPESLPSDPEHETNRTRRTSANSSGNATVVFGPVTDL